MNIQTLTTEVRRLAKLYPDAVYQRPEGQTTCSYTRGTAAGGCGCLFGQAARNVWPELYGVMERMELEGRTPSIDQVLRELVDIKAPDGWTLPPVSWCDSCQARQDGGKTWSDAVAKTDAAYPKLCGA